MCHSPIRTVCRDKTNVPFINIPNDLHASEGGHTSRYHLTLLAYMPPLILAPPTSHSWRITNCFFQHRRSWRRQSWLLWECFCGGCLRALAKSLTRPRLSVIRSRGHLFCFNRLLYHSSRLADHITLSQEPKQVLAWYKSVLIRHSDQRSNPLLAALGKPEARGNSDVVLLLIQSHSLIISLQTYIYEAHVKRRCRAIVFQLCSVTGEAIVEFQCTNIAAGDQ